MLVLFIFSKPHSSLSSLDSKLLKTKGWLCFCVLINIIIDVNEVNMIDMDF